jgi:glycosyltransferase involved in cell wall biosynthesis
LPDVAFVTKAYGSDLVGGGETLVRQFSRRLMEHGYTVEILTTCVRDYRDWDEIYSPGLSLVDNVPVRRFLLRQTVDIHEHRRLGLRLAMRLAHTEADERRWFITGLHSPALYRHLQECGCDYRLTIILDYFVGLSLYALAANTGRTAIYPQLHKEPIAYLLSVRRLLNAAHGIMFNCVPERDFAHYELGVGNPNVALVGVGVETNPVGQPERFRRRYGIAQPFLLYVGRLDVVKNVPALITCFQAYKARMGGGLKLVLMGKGPLKLPQHPDVLSVGLGSEEDKFDAYAAALALCQPSLMESLSIVTLEALAQGTPVLAHGGNDVTRYHCLTGNCGLYFYGRDDFALAVDYLRTHPHACNQLGQNGRAYVLEHYSWDKVTQRLLDAVERFSS